MRDRPISLEFPSGGGPRTARLIAAVAAVTFALAFGVQPTLGEVGGALVLVLGVTLVGALAGLLAGLAAALVAFLLYDFFLAQPVLSLRLSSAQDIVPLIVFNLSAIVAGLLAGRLTDRAAAADRSNRQLAGLLETSRALQSAVGAAEIADALARGRPLGPGAEVGLVEFRGAATHPSGAALGPGWPPLIELVRGGGQAEAELGRLLAYRLDGAEGPLGALLVERDALPWPAPGAVAALASLAALALERARLAVEVSERQAAARTEELKSALLASVSHDLRTPLTAISASASSLIDYGDRLDAETSRGLLRGIVEESERLDRTTANLIEMSRLETAPAAADLPVLDAADMLGVAIRRARNRAGERRIDFSAQAPELMVRVEPQLFELVLGNVLDNALRYGSPHGRIEVVLAREAGAPPMCRIEVADDGPGIPAGDLARVFERFYRVPGATARVQGSGLGLAIAKGFVEAQGGGIAAETPGLDGRGTRIVIRLPAADATPE